MFFQNIQKFIKAVLVGLCYEPLVILIFAQKSFRKKAPVEVIQLRGCFESTRKKLAISYVTSFSLCVCVLVCVCVQTGVCAYLCVCVCEIGRASCRERV